MDVDRGLVAETLIYEFKDTELLGEVVDSDEAVEDSKFQLLLKTISSRGMGDYVKVQYESPDPASPRMDQD